MKVAILDAQGQFTGRTYSGPMAHVPLRAGEHWVEWSPAHVLPENDQIDAWAQIRSERTRRLAECDWRVLRAVERGDAAPVDWLEYRQALRDVTTQPDPLAIIWPEPPQ